MTEHDDIVRRLREAAETTTPRDEDIDVIAARARRRRAVRWTVTTGAAAVIVVVAGFTALGFVQRYDRPARIELADGPTATAPAAPREWHALPTSPLDARWGALSASTGEGLLVWGGYAWASDDGVEGTRSDGASYDGARWSELPESPLPARVGTTGVAAWTGDELWILGGTGGDGGRTPLRDAAAYRPATRTWRELPTLPEPIAGGAWAGDRLVAVADGSRAVYALPPDGEQWRALDALPPPEPTAVDNSDLHVLAAGSRVAVVGMGDVFVRDLGGDAGGWQEVPAPGDADTLPNVRGAVADAHGLVVLLPDGLYRYDLDRGDWSRVADGLDPDPPQPIPLLRTDDGALVAVDVVNARVHAVAGDSGWTPLPPLDGSRVDATVAVVGDQIVVWGGMGSEQQGAEPGVRLPASAAG